MLFPRKANEAYQKDFASLILSPKRYDIIPERKERIFWKDSVSQSLVRMEQRSLGVKSFNSNFAVN